VITTIEYKGNQYRIDLSKPIDISIPLRNGLENPNAYYADAPKIETIKAEEFIGSVNLGGSVNYKKISITPHGNGTHTECIGHISKEDHTINQCFKDFFFFADLISIQPEQQGSDLVVTKAIVEKELQVDSTEALIIRTLPNSDEKLTKVYSGNNPPYFEVEALDLIASKNVKHLLIDLPSVDKEEDEGAVAGHKAFWNYPESPRVDNTITELIYVSDEIKDGKYFLNLQIMSLESDACPSKPILFSIDSIG